MMLKSLGSVAVIGLIPVFTGAIPLNITNDLYPRLSIPETPDLNKQCFALPGVRNPGVRYYDCHGPTLDSDGSCPGSKTADNCATYCQDNLAYNYGKEVPFADTYCQANSACQLAVAEWVAVTNGIDISIAPGINQGGDAEGIAKAVFNLGATFSYSKTDTTTTTRTYPRPTTNEQYCGYFTFIPYTVTSCGTVTVRSTWKGRFGTTYCDMAADGATTTPNWCNTTPYTNADGTAGGEIIFVYTTCDGTDQNKPLAWCFQDPAYTAQGVSTDPNVWRYKMDASLAGDDGQPVSPWQPNSVELLRCQKDPVNYVPLDPGWYANS